MRNVKVVLSGVQRYSDCLGSLHAEVDKSIKMRHAHCKHPRMQPNPLPHSDFAYLAFNAGRGLTVDIDWALGSVHNASNNLRAGCRRASEYATVRLVDQPAAGLWAGRLWRAASQGDVRELSAGAVEPSSLASRLMLRGQGGLSQPGMSKPAGALAQASKDMCPSILWIHVHLEHCIMRNIHFEEFSCKSVLCRSATGYGRRHAVACHASALLRKVHLVCRTREITRCAGTAPMWSKSAQCRLHGPFVFTIEVDRP